MIVNKKLENQILNCLPYTPPFLFVDNILEISENDILGQYTFKKTESFYSGHFKDNPVTPGVICLEMMGQIGIACLSIYFLKLYETNQKFYPLISHIDSDFLKRVYPEEPMSVYGKKIYYKNDLLKTMIVMKNPKQETVVRATSLCKLIIE